MSDEKPMLVCGDYTDTPLAAPLSYFKRYKMERDLAAAPEAPRLPPGYRWVPWTRDLLEAHARVLYECFHQEVDAKVFPSLGDREGCVNLMTAIVRKNGFLPAATWLLDGPDGAVGTIQAINERSGVGSIQNVGIVPGCRGRGLGEALVQQALGGVVQCGLGRALLEVTATNDVAIRLYRRLGFRRTKTVYKAVLEYRFA